MSFVARGWNMKLTRTALKVLTARYRAVLIRCLAGVLTVSAAQAQSLTDGTLTENKTFDGGSGTSVSSGLNIDGDSQYTLTLDGTWTFKGSNDYVFSNLKELNAARVDIDANFKISNSEVNFTQQTQIKAGATLTLESVTGSFYDISAAGTLIVDDASNITLTNALMVGTIKNGGTITLDTSNIAFDFNTVIDSYDDDTNGTLVVTGEKGAIFSSTLTNKLTVTTDSKATFNTTSNLQSDTLAISGQLIFTEESSSFNANNYSWSGTGVVKMANGMTFQGDFGSVSVSLNGDAAATGDIATGNVFFLGANTLDLGKRTLTADEIIGYDNSSQPSVEASGGVARSGVSTGIIKITLPATGNTSSILNADVSTVTIALDLSALQKKKVEKYILVEKDKELTDVFLEYDSKKYVISYTGFERKDAKNITSLTELTTEGGGTVYIGLKMGSGEQAVDDLIDGGIPVTPADEIAGDIIDELDNDDINDALDNADLKDKKNILREVGLDTANTHIAVSAARTVLDTVSARLTNIAETPRYSPYYENIRHNKTRMYKGRNGGDYVAGRASLWVRGLVNKTNFDGEHAFDADSTGFAAGLEGSPSNDWKVGIGYAYTSTDVDADRSKTDAKTNAAFLYARYKPESFYINTVGTFGHTDFKDTTKILKLKSDYSTDTVAVQAVTGYDFGTFSPEIGARYTAVHQDDYKTGLNLNVKSKTMEYATAIAGFRAGMTRYLRLNRKVAIRSELKALATYDWLRDDETRLVAMPDNSATYVMKGEAFARFGGEVGADVFLTFGGAGEIVLTYDGKFKEDYQDHTGMVSLKINF